MPAAASRLEPWQIAWASSRNDPKRFVTDVLGASPEPWQAAALDAVATEDRIAIRAGHGVGKTTFLAWTVLWFLLTRFPCKIPITANSQDQLRDIVWPEIKLWHGKLPAALRDQIEITAERVCLKAAPELGFAVARTATKERPEALQGFHSENLLFVVEEASGIPEEIFTVAAGAMSTPGAKTVMLGNPTRLSGTFYDAFHRLAQRWRGLRVNSEDVARARGHIQDITTKFGRDSNAYRVRVLGEFPTAEDDAVIALDLIEAAMGRDVGQVPSRMIWGVDVAWMGADRTTLIKRRGNQMVGYPKWWRQKDPMQVAGLVYAEYRETPIGERPETIAVDIIGMGAGVVARLREMGLPSYGVNVAESAPTKERFMRLRDELWFSTREWLETKQVRLPKPADDDHVGRDAMQGLIADLTGPKYSITSTGKIVVESKADMRGRQMASPDLADALIMTFAVSDIPSSSARSYEPQIFQDGV